MEEVAADATLLVNTEPLYLLDGEGDGEVCEEPAMETRMAIKLLRQD